MPAEQPNILFIMSDQHRWDCVGAHGHPLVETPHLDRLAREGASFPHAFTPCPMCVPARNSLLTGQWSTRHGVIHNFDGESFHPLPEDPAAPTLGRVIGGAGYTTIHLGRWHVCRRRVATDFGYHYYQPDWRYGKWRAAQELPARPKCGALGATETVADHQTAVAWGADQTMAFIDRQQADTDPFLLQWHLTEPHLPNRPPEPFASAYDPAAIEPWSGWGDTFEGKPWIQRQLVHTRGTASMAWSDWQPAVARYLAEISHIDQQIGRVLDHLDALGIAEQTLVVYTSDHGDMCGSHQMIDKHCVMYDDVLRVPLIARLPGVIEAGVRPEGFVSNVIDAPATFAELAGIELPSTWQGQSWLGLCRGEAGRDDIFSQYSGNQFGSYSQRALRDRRWKYVWNATAEDELYDLEADPGELHNRIADDACAEELVRLRGRLAAWMEATGDTLYNGNARGQLLQGKTL